MLLIFVLEYECKVANSYVLHLKMYFLAKRKMRRSITLSMSVEYK